MENKNLVAYVGDEICDIKEVYEWGDSSEKLEIIGSNYTNDKQLVILFRNPDGRGLAFMLEGKKIIKSFYQDMKIYDASKNFENQDYRKLKGKIVEGFIRNLRKNSKRNYISAIVPIYKNLSIGDEKCQKILGDIKDYGNRSEDWELKDCVNRNFDKRGPEKYKLENRFGEYFDEDDFYYFEDWELN